MTTDHHNLATPSPVRGDTTHFSAPVPADSGALWITALDLLVSPWPANADHGGCATRGASPRNPTARRRSPFAAARLSTMECDMTDTDKLLRTLRTGVDAMAEALDAAEAEQRPAPPEFPFWCRGGTHAFYVTVKSVWSLHKDGSWFENTGSMPSAVRDGCRDGMFKVITESEALDALVYPIYVSSQWPDIAFRLDRHEVWEGVRGYNSIWYCTGAGTPATVAYLHNVRVGVRRILTEDEANAIVGSEPEPALRQAVHGAIRLLDLGGSDNATRAKRVLAKAIDGGAK